MQEDKLILKRLQGLKVLINKQIILNKHLKLGNIYLQSFNFRNISNPLTSYNFPYQEEEEHFESFLTINNNKNNELTIATTKDDDKENKAVQELCKKWIQKYPKKDIEKIRFEYLQVLENAIAVHNLRLKLLE